MQLSFKNRKIFSTLLAATFSFVIFSISSCSFFMENEIPQEEAQQNEISQQGEASNPSDKNYFTLTITPTFGNTSSSGGRSAYPEFSATQLADYTFHAVCEDAFGEVQGVYNSTTGQVTFTLYCAGFTEIVEFIVKDSEGNAVWFASKENLTFTRGGSVEITSLNFQPYTSTLGNTGTLPNGNINLSVASPAGSTIICKIYNSTGTGDTLGESGETGKPIIVGGNTNTCSITTTSGIAHGKYVAKFFIYKDGSTSSTSEFRQETIVVWPGITTNAWYLSDGSKNSNLSITINYEEVKYYVKGSNPQGLYSNTGLPSVATVADASNSNAGTILAPLETINAAIAKCTSSTAKYKIICDGDLDSFAIMSGNPTSANITISGGGTSTYKSSISGQINISSSASNITFENLDISVGNLGVTAIHTTLTSDSTFVLNNCNIDNRNGGIKLTGTSGKTTNLVLNNTTISGNTTNYAVDFQAFSSKLIFKGSTFIDPSVLTKNAIRVGNTANTILVDGPLDTSHEKVATIKYQNDPTINTQLMFVQNGATLATESQRFQYVDFPKYINTQGKLDVSKDLYVASATSTPAGSSTGSGSATSPLDTVTAAIEKIKDVANISGCAGDYKIHITGTILESDHTIFLKNGTGADNTLGAFTDSTLTLCGTNKTTDILDGDNDHTVIQITGSGLQVTIENLTIQNGNGNCGGGIVVTAGATLKLGTGSVITKNANTSGYGGGGLYVEGSTLFMYSDALIGYDASEIASDSDTARANGGNIETGQYYGGGGIFAYLGASIWIGYTAENVPDTSENVCKISGNYVANNREGGGIYISSNCILNMCKGTISYNYADGKGGAIYCANELKMQGSVHIPFIAAKKNDVYLPSGKKITITGTLTPPTEANGITATITPATYDTTTVLLKDDDSGTTVNNNYSKFKVTPDGTTNWKMKSDGSICIPFNVTVNNTTYTSKDDLIAAITDYAYQNQAIDITIYEMNADDFGPSGTDGTVLNAIKSISNNANTAKLINLTVDKDANIKLPSNANSFFSNCTKLHNVDLIGLDTSDVTSMNAMFSQAFSSTGNNYAVLDIRNFDTRNVTTMSTMFYYAGGLKTIIVGPNFSTTNVETSNSMFFNAGGLIGGAGTTYSSYTIDYAHVDGGSSNPGYFTSVDQLPLQVTSENIEQVFANFSTGTNRIQITGDINADGYKAALSNAVYALNGTDKMVEIDFSTIANTNKPSAPDFTNCLNLTKITFKGGAMSDDTIKGAMYLSEVGSNHHSCFLNCTSLTTIKVVGQLAYDESWGEGDIKFAFEGCTALEEVDLTECTSIYLHAKMFANNSQNSTVKLVKYGTPGNGNLTICDTNRFTDTNFKIYYDGNGGSSYWNEPTMVGSNNKTSLIIDCMGDLHTWNGSSWN